MKVSYLGMTGYDGPAPGFEVWPAPSTYCDPAIAHASIERTLTLCEKADAPGSDWVSVYEHQYAPYMMTPNPAVMAVYLTQRVKGEKQAMLGPRLPRRNP